MRCDCCNERLTSTEAVLKHKVYGMYLNTCISCLKEAKIPYIGNLNYDECDLETDIFYEIVAQADADEDGWPYDGYS